MKQISETLRDLRGRVHQLQKQRNRVDTARKVVLTPTMLLRLRTVIMFALCGSMEWTLLWAAWFQRRQGNAYSVWRQPLSSAMILVWVHELHQHDLVQEAVASMHHPWRLRADNFLVESQVYDEVLNSSAKALEVPSATLIEWYCRKWSLRPRSARTDAHLDALKSKPRKAWQWARRFRERWSLHWGCLREVRTLSREDTQRRAAIYMRWMSWVMQQPNDSAPVIVVAMDETSVANIKRAAGGAVVRRNVQSELRQAATSAPRPMGRTSLLAAVCNDRDLQKFLPQVWLPRTHTNRLPSAEVRAVFTDCGAPQEAWHGSQGFSTSRVVRAWLRRLHRKIKLHRPGSRLVVVLDVCPAHVAPDTLATARQLDIALAFVPARLTWLLQLLDTHVFAQLKREMRKNMWAAKQRTQDGIITVPDHLRALTAATTSVIVNRSWNHLFGRVGLDGRTDNLRAGLRDLLRGVDLTPRVPSESELAVVLGAHRKHVSSVHECLFTERTSTTARQAKAASAGSAQHDPEEMERDPVLSPLLRPHQSHSVGSAAGSNEAQAAESSRPLPRARRLLPCLRNLQILPDPHEAAEQRMATRSQKRPLLAGVVGTPERSRLHLGHKPSRL